LANARNGNTYYIDTQFATNEELVVKNMKVTHIVVTSTAAGGKIVLADSSVATKIDLRVAADEDSVLFDFSANPLVFSTSIRPLTLSGAVVTCVLSGSGG